MKGCKSKSVYEKTIHEAFVQVWNGILERRDEYFPIWKENCKAEDALKAFRARQMILLTSGKPIKRVSLPLVGKVLDHCILFDDRIEFILLDGTAVSESIK